MLTAVASLLGLGLTPLAAAQDFQPSLTFGMTIGVSSALLLNPGFTNSNWTTFYDGDSVGTGGRYGTGSSSYVTTKGNLAAAFNIEFTGTGLYLNGKVSGVDETAVGLNGIVDSPVRQVAPTSSLSNTPGQLQRRLKTDYVPDKFELNLGQFSSYRYEGGIVNKADQTVLGEDVEWRIDSVTLLTAMKTDAPTFEDVATTTENFITNGELNSNFEWVNGVSANWEASTHLTPGRQYSGSGMMDYTYNTALLTEVSTKSTSVAPDFNTGGSVKIKVPANTAFFVLNGTTGTDYGSFNITIDPPSKFLTNADGPAQVWCDGGWLAPNQVLYLSPLDPSIEYTISLDRNRGGMGLSSITYYSATWDGKNDAINQTTSNNGTPVVPVGTNNQTTDGNNNGKNGSNNNSGSNDSNGSNNDGSSNSGNTNNGGNDNGSSTDGGRADGANKDAANSTSHKKSSAPLGAIIGGVVGGVVALIAIIVLIWFLRRRAVKRRRTPEESQFIVDEDLDVTPMAMAKPSVVNPPPARPQGGSSSNAYLMPFPNEKGSSSGSRTASSNLSSSEYSSDDELLGVGPSTTVREREADSGPLPPLYDPTWTQPYQPNDNAIPGSSAAPSVTVDAPAPANAPVADPQRSEKVQEMHALLSSHRY